MALAILTEYYMALRELPAPPLWALGGGPGEAAGTEAAKHSPGRISGRNGGGGGMWGAKTRRASVLLYIFE